MATNLHLKVSESDSNPRVKPAPQSSALHVPYAYFPSADGTDENLLIILHGLGDTHIPFAKLGRQLQLPQTATLALSAPQQVPYLNKEAYQWYPSFNRLGEIIERPNPSVALCLIATVLDHLVSDCSWPPQRIHLFGFAQGGRVAVESCLKWWKAQLEHLPKPREDSADDARLSPVALGSIVTISGPLLSHPTLSIICPTPLLVFHRSAPSDSALSSGDFSSFRKGFAIVEEIKFAGEGMPNSKDEWFPVMKFWSQRLGKRQIDGMYEVAGGLPT